MCNLLWSEDTYLSHSCCLLSVCSYLSYILSIAVKKHCDQDKLFAVSEGEPMAIMVGSVAAGGHGTGVVAVSLLLIHKQESERQKQIIPGVDFCNLKVYCLITYIPPNPSQIVHQLRTILSYSSYSVILFCDFLYLNSLPVMYVSNSGHFPDFKTFMCLLLISA